MPSLLIIINNLVFSEADDAAAEISTSCRRM